MTHPAHHPRPSDLHTRIREALQERTRLAAACLAEVGSTRAGEMYSDGSGTAERDDFPSYPWGVGEAELAYLKVNDPASTIRRAEAGLRTLDRHAPHICDCGKDTCPRLPECLVCEPNDWPCADILALAAGEGIQP